MDVQPLSRPFLVLARHTIRVRTVPSFALRDEEDEGDEEEDHPATYVL